MTDWFKSFTSLFGNRWRHHTEMNIDEAEEAMKVLEDLYNNTEDEKLKHILNNDIDRLQYAQNYYKWLMRFIEVIESGEIFEFIPKEQPKQ